MKILKKLSLFLLTASISFTMNAQTIIGIDKTGQSNCGATDTVLTDTASKYGEEYEFVKVLNTQGDSSNWLDDVPRFQNFQARVNSTIGSPIYNKYYYGAEISTLYWYNQDNPNTTIYFYKACLGAADIVVWLKDNSHVWYNSFYSGLYQKYSQLKYLGIADDYDLRYLIHTHGENAADNVDRANAYKSNMLQFYSEYNSAIHEISQKLGIATDTTYTVLLTDLVSSHPYDTTVQRVVNELANENDWIKKISVEESWLGTDDLHYSSSGCINLGMAINDTIRVIENP